MNSTYKLVVDGYLRYVGKTEKALARRLQEHLSEARGPKRNHRLNWLRSCSQPPTIELIEETSTELGTASEIYWIALARVYGCNLVNGTDGGEGASGHRHSPETRKKLSRANRGKKRSSEFCNHLRVINSGRGHPQFGKPKSEEQKEKISLSLTGKKQSEETVAKRVAANTGKKWSPAQIKKVSGSHNQQFGKTGNKSPNFGIKKSPAAILRREETKRQKREERVRAS